MEKERESDLVKEFYDLTETYQHKREIMFLAELYKGFELKRKKALKFVTKYERLNTVNFATLQEAYWKCVKKANLKHKNDEAIVTKAEDICFASIKSISRVKFYRSFWIKNFCVDFFIPRYGAVLEVDGGIHFNEIKMRKDEFKECYLMDKFKIAVWRVDNKDVETYIYKNLSRIRNKNKLSSKALKSIMSRVFIDTIVYHADHGELVRIVGEDFYIAYKDYYSQKSQKNNLDKKTKMIYNNRQRSLTVKYSGRQLNPGPL